MKSDFPLKLRALSFIALFLVVFASCENGRNIIPDVPQVPTKPYEISKVKVLEYLPAPGQFVNDKVYSFAPEVTTLEGAVAAAQKRLDSTLSGDVKLTTLGAFGGRLVVDFGKDVKPSGFEYDLIIGGNAFDGSSEPAIVWVMEDTNKNGKADDTWYELKGGMEGTPGIIRNYEVTYTRPSAPDQDVPWKDNQGKSGVVPHNEYHDQCYYPACIAEDSYTLSGTLLPCTVQNNGGIYSFGSFKWGYADSFGTDRLEPEDPTEDFNQVNRFSLSNAINDSGTPVKLKSFRFVKVHTAVQVYAPAIGEASSEISFFALPLK